MTTRREMLIALGTGTIATPLASFAQQSKVWRIGHLDFGSRQPALDSGRYGAFLQGLRELGCGSGSWGRLGGPASEYGRLCQGVGPTDGAPAPGGCLKLPMLPWRQEKRFV